MIYKSVFNVDYIIHNDTMPAYEKYDIKVYSHINRHGLRMGNIYHTGKDISIAKSYVYMCNDTVFAELAGLNKPIIDSILHIVPTFDDSPFLFKRMSANYRKARKLMIGKLNDWIWIKRE